jgi:hypothetical protein
MQAINRFKEVTMKTKLTVALTMALCIALLLTAVAAAEHGSGTGTLTAQGDGLAVMRGAGTITLSGSGVLTIRDLGDDAKVIWTGKGFKRELNDRTVIYGGFNGQATITGSNILVSLKGKNIDLKATGTGKFLLRGHGTYSTEHESGEWTEQGQTVILP